MNRANGKTGWHGRKLHRIDEVRRQEGISLRSVARRTKKTMAELANQEDGHADLRLSSLYLWQKALDVPITDLLVEPTQRLSEPILKRCRLLKLVKTARTIKDRSQDKGVQRLANMLYSQLIEMMPELSDVKGWPEVGQRRSGTELGKIAEHPYPDEWTSEKTT